MTIDPTHYRQMFFTEAADHLAALEVVLLRLEADPHDREAVADAFRLAHSVKGAAAAVGFPDVANFTHGLEGVLGRLRDDPRPVPVALTDVLLQATDHLAALVSAAQTGDPSPAAGADLTARLTAGALDAPEPARPPEVSAAPNRAGPGAYVVTVAPAAETFRSGLDPLPLLRDLARMGSVAAVRLHADALPALADLDPERCYLTWTVRIETTESPEALADVFAFAGHVIDVTIRPDEPPAPAARASAPTPPPPALAPQPAEDSPRLDPLWFGSFLCKREVITAQQLKTAFDHLRRSRPMTGVLAVQEGLLVAEQLPDLLSRMEPGERFGDTAVRLGCLTEADLWHLHLRHQERMPALGTVLLELGLIDPARLEAEEAAFVLCMERMSRDSGPTPAVPTADSAAPPAPAPSVAMDYDVLAENAEMIGEFCTEADDHLLAADRNLLELDADPTNKRAVDAIYRGFHTIKGVSSMLGLGAVQGLAHEAENLLNLARDGKIVLRGRPLDMAFASTDGLKRQFGFVRDWLQRRGQMEQDPLFGQLLADLRATTEGEPGRPAPPPTVIQTEPVVEHLARTPAPPESAPEPAAPSPMVVAPAEPAEEKEPPRGGARRPATAEKETVRVDRDRLDKLINIIGELVIAQAMAEEEVAETVRRAGGQLRAMGELTKISRSLQELGLSLRMVPLQGIFQKMSRLVRDLSRKMDKPVELELHGEETELDKTVVDHLGDPLMHMVRNAVDHGLESPEERTAAGKPATGRVTLRAYHQGGNVYIELTDDGKGLDRDKLVKKAVEKGIIAEGARLTDPEAYALIFEAGFSTAKAVTDVSGRGVGMDVVRRNVEELHGSILIRTELGKGTTFVIRLPLTLAIMEGLMVALGDDVYLLPLLAVVESVRPLRSDLRTVAGRGEVVTVRGETVPLVRLHALLGRPVRVTDPCQGLVVLVEDDGKKYALLVDDLLGQMQAVVKSLDTHYRPVEGLTGATILGDGRVAMILDVHGLTKLHARIGGGRAPALQTAAHTASLGDDR